MLLKLRFQFGRDGHGEGRLVSNHLSRRAGQTKIPIGGQILQGYEVLADWCLVGDFINSGPFVDFVEHSDKNAAYAELFENGELPPVEFTALARNSGRAGALSNEVIPRESGESCGHVANSQGLQFRQIAFPAIGPNGVHCAIVAVSAGIPRTDGVEHAIDFIPAGLGSRRALKCAPMRIDAADEVNAAVFRIIFEKLDQLLALFGGPGAIFEAEAP